jgi:TP901 family phage tail tape measure protein
LTVATLTSRLIVSLTDRVTGPARGIGAALGRLHRQGQRTSGALIGGGAGMMGGTVRSMLALGAGYIGVSKAIGGTVGAAIKFEEKFADVRKVVDGTPAQLSAVRSEILDLSKRLPVTAEGIADIYAAAGQSGVAINELGKFSEMAAKVSVAWDTSQSETGDALAKIKTQLQFNVDQLGLHADAINHLSNNSASAARNLVDFDKRVAAVGKMFGFTDTQTLAFGSSMISAGAESEVAATSFRNMGKALTVGERATKKQRVAFSKLGLDSVKTAKNMQKNALKTTLDVMDRIQKLPAWQRNSIASALFGDEARGLLPVLADTRELRRELELVGTSANYSGSAFNEYLVRAQTTSNALEIIGNKLRAKGIEIGDSWLPTIKEIGLGVGDLLDTLKQRVGVLDDVQFAFQGFMGGIGYGGAGGLREAINDIGDLFFGKAFGGSLYDADERVSGLARLSNKFREIGQNVRQFASDVAGNPIARFLAGLSGQGFKLMLASVGIGMLASALWKLGRAAAFLSGLTTVIGIVKGLGRAGGLLVNGKPGGTPTGKPTNTPGTKVPATKDIAKATPFLSGLGTAVVGGAIVAGVAAAIAEFGPDVVKKARTPEKGTPAWWLGLDPTESREDRLDRLNEERTRSRGGPLRRGRDRGDVERQRSLDNYLNFMPPVRSTSGGPAEVNVIGIPEVSIPSPVTTQPSGTQDVRVTNPMPAPIVNITVNARTDASPSEIAAAAGNEFSRMLAGMSSGAYSDGAN